MLHSKKRFAYLITTIFLVLLFSSVYLTLSLSSLTEPKNTFAQNSPDIEAIAKDTSCYMNKVIEGAGNLSNVKLLSPAFNMTSQYFQPLVNAMQNNGARFASLDAIAGNAYNAFGKTITQHVNDSMNNSPFRGKPIFLTETGNFDTSDKNLLRSELDKIKNNAGQNYIGGTLFNAFNTNPGFPHGILSDSDLNTVCNGNCGKIGVNSAAFFNQGTGYYDRAKRNGMAFELSMARNGMAGYSDTLAGIQTARSLGITPVIRIWFEGGAFDDPEVYVEFLKKLDSEVNFTVYAIAGSNEPESDNFLPDCDPSDSNPNEESGENSSVVIQKIKQPKPQPYVFCNETRGDEFHSLRPYPASPCNEPPGASKTSPTALMCGNDLEFKQTFTLPRSAANYCESDSRCFYSFDSQANVSIDLSEAEFPILGNTELVPNVTQKGNALTSAQRLNEYVSWYLNGVLSPEDEKRNSFRNPSEQYIEKVINFSGPLEKLLPLGVKAIEKKNTIFDAVESRFANANIRHDQIAGCVVQGLFDDFPANCLTSERTSFQRLTDWITHLPPIEDAYNSIAEYWRDYITWQGRFCYFRNFCSSVISPTKWWASIFSYVPLSTTEDKKGEIELFADEFQKGEGPTIVMQPTVEEGKITSLQFEPAGGQNIIESTEGVSVKKYLFFPHTAENAELGHLLQKTYTPGGENGYSGESGDGALYNTGRCKIIDSRTNPGDDLYGEYHETNEGDIRGVVTYSTEFFCNLQPQGPGQEPVCIKDINVAAGSVYTRTPNAEEIWERFVNGNFSVFKRIFPKVGPGAPVTEIKDIPAVTKATYNASGAGEGGSLPAELYFSHIGSVDEYFTKGIQTALRPKGFASQPITGIPTTGSGTGTGTGAGSGDPGTPGAGGCNIIPSGRWCGVDFLTSYFGSEAKARTASRICNAESHADPFVVRDTCQSSGDVSIGLFQINIRAHSLVDPNTGETLVCPAAFEGGASNRIGNCNVVNQSLKEKCISALRDNPEYQIEKAVGISSNGTNWNQWSTYTQIAACRFP